MNTRTAMMIQEQKRIKETFWNNNGLTPKFVSDPEGILAVRDAGAGSYDMQVLCWMREEDYYELASEESASERHRYDNLQRFNSYISEVVAHHYNGWVMAWVLVLGDDLGEDHEDE